MTREEIERLEGRELDAVVEELIFGHEVVWLVEDRAKLVRRLPDGRYLLVPEYSTQMVLAWDVVEQMERNGWGWTVNTLRNPDRECYHASFRRADSDISWHGYDEKSPATAICRAALLALAMEALGVEAGDDD